MTIAGKSLVHICQTVASESDSTCVGHDASGFSTFTNLWKNVPHGPWRWSWTKDPPQSDSRMNRTASFSICSHTNVHTRQDDSSRDDSLQHDRMFELILVKSVCFPGNRIPAASELRVSEWVRWTANMVLPGFRQGHSTETTLVRVTIRLQMIADGRSTSARVHETVCRFRQCWPQHSLAPAGFNSHLWGRTEITQSLVGFPRSHS